MNCHWYFISNKPAQGDDSSTAADSTAEPVERKVEYDIFVSYAHANEDVCKVIVQALQNQISDVKIFIDREELRTGNAQVFDCVESSGGGK